MAEVTEPLGERASRAALLRDVWFWGSRLILCYALTVLGGYLTWLALKWIGVHD